jgi:hypothetical protein
MEKEVNEISNIVSLEDWKDAVRFCSISNKFNGTNITPREVLEAKAALKDT